jgi:hypothetical protein
MSFISSGFSLRPFCVHNACTNTTCLEQLVATQITNDEFNSVTYLGCKYARTGHAQLCTAGCHVPASVPQISRCAQRHAQPLLLGAITHLIQSKHDYFVCTPTAELKQPRAVSLSKRSIFRLVIYACICTLLPSHAYAAPATRSASIRREAVGRGPPHFV